MSTRLEDPGPAASVPRRSQEEHAVVRLHAQKHAATRLILLGSDSDMLRHSVDIPDVTLERILAIVRTPSPGSVGKLHGRERTARRTCGPRIGARAPDRASEPSAADRAIRFA